jgi:NADH:ubiquinone oxidoreductase subunit H
MMSSVRFVFLTLFKRNILGSVPIRNNSNTICFIGIIDPLSDVIELFSGEQHFSWIYNYLHCSFLLFSVYFFL